MRKRSLVFAAALVISGIAVPTAAWAEPSGCSHDTPSFWTSGTAGFNLMNAQSTGTCSTVATRTFRVEIKHDISFAPDPLVSHADDYENGTRYGARTTTCDAGASATYYGRSFYTSSASYHDSSHQHVDTCD
jgi:hypothetical protein